MPCHCDGFEDDQLNAIADERDRLEKELCRARAIIMKMLEQGNGGHGLHAESGFAKDLERKAENEVRLLLHHKRQEIGRDVTELDKKINTIKLQIKKIEELGGQASPGLLTGLEALEFQRTRLLSMTDKEILGT